MNGAFKFHAHAGLLCNASRVIRRSCYQTLLNRNRVSCLTMPFTFTTEEYADMVFICVVCEGNATAAVAEYHRRYPHRRIPNPKTISGFNTLRHTATLPSFHTPYKRSPQHNVAEEENILDAVQHSPRTSTRRVARRLVVNQWCGGHSAPG